MKQTHSYDTHILAIGPHPDDVEIGCGGVLYQTAKQGKQNVILDLSPSQLSTNGDPETRQDEALCAAQRLHVAYRENLQLDDGHLEDTPELRKILATHIRKRKPEIVLMPWGCDRHPDHEVAAQLIKNAVFYAGLSKIELDGLPIHKPRMLMHYMIWKEFEPDFIVKLEDDAFQHKMDAFTCYTSQYKTNSRGFEYVEARHIVHGHRIGTRYGEGYKLYSHAVGVESFDCVTSGFF